MSQIDDLLAEAEELVQEDQRNNLVQNDQFKTMAMSNGDSNISLPEQPRNGRAKKNGRANGETPRDLDNDSHNF